MGHRHFANYTMAGSFLVGAATASISGIANAQMTSTNCMVAGNMINCTSFGDDGYQAQENARRVGEGIGKLIVAIGEKGFRKKVGRMLADGDCSGASRYAYEKGRLELGASIAEACRPTPISNGSPVRDAQPVIDPSELESALINIAANAKTPVEIFDRTSVTKVEASGRQLVLTAMVSDPGANITEPSRRNIVRQMCDASGPLMQAGATVRINFFHQAAKQPQPFDVVAATWRDCFR